MQEIHLAVEGMEVGFEQAMAMARLLAAPEDEEVMLISWNDRLRDKHSPCCLQCEIHGAPGWEIYGKNHGGRLRISVNHDEYVFIFS